VGVLARHHLAERLERLVALILAVEDLGRGDADVGVRARQALADAVRGAAPEVLELPDALPQGGAPRLLDAVEDLVDPLLRILRGEQKARADEGGNERDGGGGGDSRHGVLLNCLGQSADPIIIDVAGQGYVLNDSRFAK
jgi:hypothetical protein